MADMIIPDLARWEDWSVMEKLVRLFKEADEDTNWIRVPIITYLRACPKPEAKKHIEELAKIDPNAVRRADYFLDFDIDDEEDSDDQTDSVDGQSEEKGKNSDENNQKKNPPKDSSIKGKSLNEADSLAQPEKDSGPVLVVAKKPAFTEKQAFLENSSTVNIVSSQDVYNQSVPSMTDSRATDVAQISRATPMPVAAVKTPNASVTSVLVVPLVSSMIIFLLLWSVISGWFERLIF